ncbi:MAG: hypothetical protein KDC98_15840, partial [Planctomycetes bacterium]|nr:hypothetical protein [Planctomycetota bacterium]
MNDSGRSSAVFLVLTLLLLGGAGLSAWVLLARDSAQDLPIVDPAPANGAAGQTPVVPPVTAGAEVASEHQAENASAAPTMLELPDGTAMPNLNGVKIKVNFLWPQD